MLIPFLSFLFVLTAILAYGVKSKHVCWVDLILAVLVLDWAALVLAAHVLSLFSALGQTVPYIGASIGFAVLMALGLRAIRPKRDVYQPAWPCNLPPQIISALGWFLAGTAALALLGDLILAYGMLPANPDSIAYRFPRVYWYFSQGSLHHFTTGGDPRPLFYPFNGALAYLPLIHFQLGPRFFSLLSLSCWLAIALATYRFSRNFGAPRVMAAATAWIVCLAPNILVQSLSTNDDMIAAAPLLVGLYFVHRWFLRRQFFDAVIGAIGIGISVGTKLHVTFYWPMLLIIAIVLLFNYRAVSQEARSWMSLRGGAVLAVMVVTVILFGFSFLAYNYAATGRLMPWEFAGQVLNKPFSFAVAVQTIVLFTSQVVLTPIADLHVAFDPTIRAEHYEAFNRLLAPLFTWVDNGPTYVSAFYRFTGVNSPSSLSFNEHTLFFGFTWVVVILAASRLAWKPPGQALWPRFQILALPLWFVTYASSSRYIEGSAVYIGYALVISGPALVYAFAPIERTALDRLRWALLAFVCATHSFFALQVFLTSGPRNLPVLARGLPLLPISRGFLVDASVNDEISQARRGVYHRTISWEQPYWAFMAYHPNIPHLFVRPPSEIPNPKGDTASDEASVSLRNSRYALMPEAGDPHLYLYSFAKWPLWGWIAVRIPDKLSSGLTWIGDMMFTLGPEWVFAAGNAVEQRHPGCDKYIVLQFLEQSNYGHDPKPMLTIQPIVYGLGPDDNLSFRFDLKIGGRVADRTDWRPSPSANLNTTGLTDNNGVLTISVRNNNAGGAVTSSNVALRSKRTSPVPGKPQARSLSSVNAKCSLGNL